MIVNYFSLIFAARRIPSLAAQPEDPLIDVNKQVLTKIGNFQQRMVRTTLVSEPPSNGTLTSMRASG